MKQSLLLIATIALLNALPAAAQDSANAQKALAKAQFLLRQTTAEKTALQQEVDALKKQVEALNKQLAESKSGAAARQQSVEQRLAGSSNRWRESQEKLNEQLSGTREQLKAQSKETADLRQQLQAQSENFRVCYANNQKLYDINKELLAQYNNKGVFDTLKQKEPFTGLKQVEVENLIQDYQYKLDDLNLSMGGAALPADESTYTGP